MPSCLQLRTWVVRARFVGSHWSRSGWLTYKQAQRLAEALSVAGMETRLEYVAITRQVAA